MSDANEDLRAALLMITHKANEAAIYRDEDDVLETIIDIARAALAAAPQPAPERETCEVCCGTGIAGHPDSGYTCYRCKGQGGIEPQPVVDREALVDDDSLSRQIEDLGNQIHNLGCEHQNDEELSERLQELRTTAWELARRADALLARGLRLPVVDHEPASGDTQAPLPITDDTQATRAVLAER